MIRLSSSFTLALVVFIPVFWFVFFGCFTLFILLMDPQDIPMNNSNNFKMALVFFFLIFAFIIYKFLVKLKRVEIENDHLFITNYFKTISIPLQGVIKISDQSIANIRIVCLEFNQGTSFGKKIRFISNTQKYNYLMNEYHRANNS